MKYCNQCGKMTAGDALYCSHCGRTYDVRLCPRQHVNPRGAEVCSKCGSRELSTPQPAIPIVLQFLVLMARIVLGLALFYATLELVIVLARSAQVQQFFLACGGLLAVLWVLWSKLPNWSRDALRDFWIKQRNNDDE
ncbi:MAG: zinc ribbon domain-containing protein [Terriglobales bacterium]